MARGISVRQTTKWTNRFWVEIWQGERDWERERERERKKECVCHSWKLFAIASSRETDGADSCKTQWQVYRGEHFCHQRDCKWALRSAARVFCHATVKLIRLKLEGARRVHISAKLILGVTTLEKPPFGNFVRGHVQTVHGNMRIKFEVFVFNQIGAISI